MELKRRYIDGVTDAFPLLIVPYGIETGFVIYICSDRRFLLIVPYGIETAQRHHGSRPPSLLIVPYGIETAFRKPDPKTKNAFNRTLWN